MSVLLEGVQDRIGCVALAGSSNVPEFNGNNENCGRSRGRAAINVIALICNVLNVLCLCEVNVKYAVFSFRESCGARASIAASTAIAAIISRIASVCKYVNIHAPAVVFGVVV